jgi:hypothetical protein
VPWQQSIFPLLVVSAGAGYSGLFVYSPAPGPGALVSSEAGSAGTDPYGNAYVPGNITYAQLGGTVVAYGQQAGAAYFATAPAGSPNPQAVTYTVASGTLRNIYGPLLNGFSQGTDVNGTLDPPALTQLDAHTIAMAGRLNTPGAGAVLLTTFATISGPFILPAAAAPVPEFPCGNAGGNQGGSVILRPNGNMQLTGNFGNGVTVYTSGTFRF